MKHRETETQQTGFCLHILTILAEWDFLNADAFTKNLEQTVPAYIISKTHSMIQATPLSVL